MAVDIKFVVAVKDRFVRSGGCNINYVVVKYVLMMCLYQEDLKLTLCPSYLKPYCMGRMSTFFSAGI